MKDETTQVVIVIWDETAMELTKSSAKTLFDVLDEVAVQFKFRLYVYVSYNVCLRVCMGRLKTMPRRCHML